MSGQNWSIVIAPSTTRGGPASFTPDLMGAVTGAPLEAGNADIISWNNLTSFRHQPVALDPDGQPLSEADARNQKLYLSDPIEPNRSSSPGFVTTALTTGDVLVINYRCAFHRDEQGTIRVFNT